jgi:glycosyltransferase involved in cell wall biosynthesis
MRIVLVNSVSGSGGGVSSTLTLLRGLARAGHSVTLVCNARGELHHRTGPQTGAQVIPLRMGPDLDPIAAARIAGVLRRERPDVVLADRRKDVKALVLAGTLGHRAPIVHRHGAPSSLRDSRLNRFFWGRVRCIVVNSAAMRDRMLTAVAWLDADRVSVIHNGVDTEHFRPHPEDRARVRAELGFTAEDFVVAFHGVLQPRKRVDLLIRGAARAGARRPLSLLIVGDGPDRAALDALARELGVPAHFTGRRTDVPALLAAADVGAHLSSAEGFSNSVLECLACGLPVIATAEHSHPEQIDHERTGLLVEAQAPAVASALSRLADDAALTARMGSAARDDALRRFSVTAMVTEYERVLETVRTGAAPGTGRSADPARSVHFPQSGV